MMEIIYTPQAPNPIGPYSQATKMQNMLFCSGQIAIEPENGQFLQENINLQTEQGCRNIQAVLRSAGLELKHVVKTTCFLVESEDFVPFNEVYGRFFAHSPARSCVFVQGLPKGAKVEIEVIAAF